MNEHIIIENMRPVTGKGSLRAHFDIRLDGGIKVRDCRVVQQEGKQPWVSLPVSEWKTTLGQQYKTLVELPPEMKKAVSEAAIAAWQSKSK